MAHRDVDWRVRRHGTRCPVRRTGRFGTGAGHALSRRGQALRQAPPRPAHPRRSQHHPPVHGGGGAHDHRWPAAAVLAGGLAVHPYRHALATCHSALCPSRLVHGCRRTGQVHDARRGGHRLPAHVAVAPAETAAARGRLACRVRLPCGRGLRHVAHPAMERPERLGGVQARGHPRRGHRQGQQGLSATGQTAGTPRRATGRCHTMVAAAHAGHGMAFAAHRLDGRRPSRRTCRGGGPRRGRTPVVIAVLCLHAAMGRHHAMESAHPHLPQLARHELCGRHHPCRRRG